MKAVLFALVVLGLVYSSENDDITLIHKIDATTLGKTLFDTIFM
jgi:hypothetical protein